LVDDVTTPTHPYPLMAIRVEKKCIYSIFSIYALNLSKVTVKIFIMLQKIYISNKCSFELVYQRVMKKKNNYKILSRKTIFNNLKYFLSTNSA